MSQTPTLPPPLDTIVIENLRGTYKDFHASPDYPLKGVTYPVDYGYLPGYIGEDGHDLDFFVGNQANGLFGYIRVSRPDTKDGETKFFVAVTQQEMEEIGQVFRPVLLESMVFQGVNELLLNIESFRKV